MWGINCGCITSVRTVHDVHILPLVSWSNLLLSRPDDYAFPASKTENDLKGPPRLIFMLFTFQCRLCELTCKVAKSIAIGDDGVLQ